MQGRGWGRAALLVVLLFIIPQSVIAYTVSGFSVDPTGDVVSGQQMQISFTLYFNRTGQETFPSENSLQLFTDLEHPKWSSMFVLDGVENPRPYAGDRSVSLSGFDLTYPSAISESMLVMLDGTAPYVNKTTNIALIRIEELDKKGMPVPDSVFEYPARVIYLKDVSCCILPTDEILQLFRYDIDEKAASGVDTSAAETKYTTAKQKIAAARVLPSTQYAAALNKISSARNDIEDGERLLDRAWAEMEVTAAQKRVDRADEVIGWFKGNESTANYYRLDSISADRDVASELISSATNDIKNCNYSLARSKVQEAYLKANESYNNATMSRRILLDSDCTFCSHLPNDWYSALFVATGIGAIALLIKGIIWWRKKRAAGLQ